MLGLAHYNKTVSYAYAGQVTLHNDIRFLQHESSRMKYEKAYLDVLSYASIQDYPLHINAASATERELWLPGGVVTPT